MIYLDNAATSFPKPPQVIRAMAGVMERLGANPGRSGHRLALQAGRVVQACREEAAALFGADKPEQVVFTPGCTEALNLAIAGTLHPGDEVLVTPFEHNAVMRVLRRYQDWGQITVRVLEADALGQVQPHVLQRAIGARTALVIAGHASNVSGVVQPVGQLGAVCRENGVPLLVDAAQTAGVLDVTLQGLRADMIAVPGHKGLMGPPGTGLLVLAEGVSPEPLTVGGTGSVSESLRQPAMLPDRYESGTLNLPGIAGLMQGIRFVRRHRREIHAYEHHLAACFREQVAALPGVRVLGHPDAPRVGMVTITAQTADSAQLADDLNAAGVAVRGGLHCAPSAHGWYGTLGSGAVRFSPGVYTTRRQMDDAALLLSRILRTP